MMNKQEELPLPVLFQKAAELIKKGRVVAFPTETYYGLAVDPFNEASLQRLFKIKQREMRKPILTLINRVEELRFLTWQSAELYKIIIDKFWPGPVTLIFRARSELSPLLTGNTATVGVRISSNIFARTLCAHVGGPLTATSANLSGFNAAVTAEEVRDQLGSEVDMIIDGGATPGGKGSTIISYGESGLELVRDGVIPYNQIEEVA